MLTLTQKFSVVFVSNIITILYHLIVFLLILNKGYLMSVVLKYIKLIVNEDTM